MTTFFSSQHHFCRPFYLLLTLAVLGGCAAQQIPPPPLPEPVAETEETRYRPFPADTLEALLTAEFSGVRNDEKRAMDLYMEQALKTSDPGVFDRAVRIANFLDRQDLLLELARHWVALEPDNLAVRRLAAFQLARAGKVLEAFPHGEYLLIAGDDDYLQSLSAYAADVSQQEKQQLLALYNQLALNYGDNAPLLLGKAMLLRQLGNNQDSLNTVRQVIALEPENETGQLLYAQLLHQQGDPETAEKVLKKALTKQPKSRRLRLQYARFLSESDLPASRDQMAILISHYPADGDLRFSLALVELQLENITAAQDLFATLILHHQRVGDSYFQLGYLAEQQGDTAAAVDYYRHVNEGESLLAAAVRLTDLLARQNSLDSARDYLHSLSRQSPQLAENLRQIEVELLIREKAFDEARQLLDQGLAEDPDNINLLYNRSVVSAQEQDLATSEADLRAILALEPDNATALNALGYTLTLLSVRYQEAEQLIRRALELEPQNPAIIDSLGWVLYRTGNLEEALKYLEQAYTAYPDPEVAAHLGEVLWVSGDQQRALEIWHEALASSPDNPLIVDVLQKFQGSNHETATSP